MPLCQGPCQPHSDVARFNQVVLLLGFTASGARNIQVAFRHWGIFRLGQRVASRTWCVIATLRPALRAYLSDISCTRSVRPGWSSTELLEFLKVSFISSFLRSISHWPMTILWIWKIFLPDAGPGPSCLDNGLPCQSPRGAQVDWALRIHRWGALHLE